MTAMGETTGPLATSYLPHALSEGMMRGVRGKCPRCAGAPLFAKFLKPVARCRACGQDWSLHQADDFPPYVSIFLTGHLMAPVIIALAMETSVPLWVMMAIALVLASLLMISLLQPAKGAIIAMQWWLGLAGFAGASGKDEAARLHDEGTVEPR